MSTESIAQPTRLRVLPGRRGTDHANWLIRQLTRRGELIGLMGLAGVLNLWGLSINGWANTYYSAAVRSMSTSWHNFLFASLDQSGLMTVDKPPLSLWIQALSARVFGFNSLSLLIPEALMGVAAVALVYDLVRRRFGRAAGFVGGLVLATTPVVVAVSRHNNPDELLALCSVAAVWAALRGLETGRTCWLVASGICIGLGFETKMGVALMVLPGIAAAWMWVAPRGRLRALRQLLAGGAAMAVVGGAWPLLVTLTPAADRPWISGTSDNSILSLIFGYNGLGRIAGQAGGPQALGGGGSMFGGSTGPFRLLQSGLGDQAGWLLGFALVSGLGILAATRLRRTNPRTGWLIVVGGAFLTTAVVFSFASGIFHPYYVSLLAPFAAALVGAGAGQMLRRGTGARILAPLAIAGGAITELVILGQLNGQLSWATPVVLVAAITAAAGLALNFGRRTRAILVSVALAAFLAAPATWAAETLGHATNGTFPTGGPASALSAGRGGPGGPGGFGARPGGAFPRPPAGAANGVGAPGGGSPPPFGAPGGGPGGAFGATAGGPGGAFGGGAASLQAAISYANAHGGGTIGVASQSTAAPAILTLKANVAGLGGFSGRESSVTVSWLAAEVRTGRLRWVITTGQGGGAPGDTRTGSSSAMTAVTRVCRAVPLSSSAAGGTQTMYDCAGRASALARLG
jgi:4-amino-4-deoxy-L-arabinose transferase-like glycosyltransferase